MSLEDKPRSDLNTAYNQARYISRVLPGIFIEDTYTKKRGSFFPQDRLEAIVIKEERDGNKIIKVGKHKMDLWELRRVKPVVRKPFFPGSSDFLIKDLSDFQLLWNNAYRNVSINHIVLSHAEISYPEEWDSRAAASIRIKNPRDERNITSLGKTNTKWITKPIDRKTNSIQLSGIEVSLAGSNTSWRGSSIVELVNAQGKVVAEGEVKWEVPVLYTTNIATGSDSWLGWLCNKMLIQACEPNEFSEAFSELKGEADGYMTLAIDELINHLKLRLKNESGQITLAGTPVKKDAIRTWGLLILVSIQLYFLLHLAAFNRTYNRVAPFPWVGLYRGKLPQTIFFFSSILFPPATAIAITIIDFHSIRNVGVPVVATSISLATAAGMGRVIKTLVSNSSK